jgi:hypothetical protein
MAGIGVVEDPVGVRWLIRDQGVGEVRCPVGRVEGAVVKRIADGEAWIEV